MVKESLTLEIYTIKILSILMPYMSYLFAAFKTHQRKIEGVYVK